MPSQSGQSKAFRVKRKAKKEKVDKWAVALLVFCVGAVLSVLWFQFYPFDDAIVFNRWFLRSGGFSVASLVNGEAQAAKAISAGSLVTFCPYSAGLSYRTARNEELREELFQLVKNETINPTLATTLALVSEGRNGSSFWFRWFSIIPKNLVTPGAFPKEYVSLIAPPKGPIVAQWNKDVSDLVAAGAKLKYFQEQPEFNAGIDIPEAEWAVAVVSEFMIDGFVLPGILDGIQGHWNPRESLSINTQFSYPDRPSDPGVALISQKAIAKGQKLSVHLRSMSSSLASLLKYGVLDDDQPVAFYLLWENNATYSQADVMRTVQNSDLCKNSLPLGIRIFFPDRSPAFGLPFVNGEFTCLAAQLVHFDEETGSVEDGLKYFSQPSRSQASPFSRGERAAAQVIVGACEEALKEYQRAPSASIKHVERHAAAGVDLAKKVLKFRADSKKAIDACLKHAQKLQDDMSREFSEAKLSSLREADPEVEVIEEDA